MTAPTAPADARSCDARYATTECLWGDRHDPLAERVAEQIRGEGARVLDVGCGEGRNAAFFAERGAAVHAVDASPLALANGRRRWPDLRIAWEEADVRELRFPPSAFEAVFACSVLHWLGDVDVVDRVLCRLQEATRPGGVHGLVVFNDRQPYEPPAGESLRPLLLPHAWYLDRYAGWRILHLSDSDSSERHPGHWEPHRHAVTRLVAAKTLDG